MFEKELPEDEEPGGGLGGFFAKAALSAAFCSSSRIKALSGSKSSPDMIAARNWDQTRRQMLTLLNQFDGN
jgi:hypothetical protein